MSAHNQLFLEWEERIISQEKGNRVVHYYLKHFSGDTVLAVVGTERSVRHMIYIVSDDLLNSYGYLRIVKPGTKWRARREVVEWLSKLVSKYSHSVTISNSLTTGSSESLKSSEFSMAGIATDLVEQMIPRKLKVQSSNIVWSGDAWSCSKQLNHYPAFCRNGVSISVYSFAYIMGEGETRYLAYLEDLYEDKKGQKKVKVRWFHYNQEVQDLIPQLNAHPKEVFITPHEQVISVECIDGVALVLTPKDYEKYMAQHPQSTASGVHMCHRELRNKKVKLFSLSKMRGYTNQASLSCHVSQPNLAVYKSIKKLEGYSDKDLRGQGVKKPRSFRGNQNMESDSGAANSVPENQITKCEPTHQKLKIKLSNKGAIGIQLVGPEPSFKVGDSIELLCQDSGMRGCWFRCKVLQASDKRLKVQYYDVEDVDGPGKLEEWVLASKIAAPDKLGMRNSGRLRVRPWPPVDSSDSAIKIGAAVDAWWCDGWWEGVVTGIDKSGSGCVECYFPGENKVLSFQRNKLRISRDWIHKKWVEIEAKPDILSLLSSTPNGETKPSMPSSSAEASGSALADCKVISSPNLDTIQEDEQEIVDLPRGGLPLKKKLWIKEATDKVNNRMSSNCNNNGSRGKAKSALKQAFDSQANISKS